MMVDGENPTTDLYREQAQLVTRLRSWHDAMLAAWGPQGWWPGDSPWEVAVGAVLTQNTNWGSVEKAITRLKAAESLTPEAIDALPSADLAELIRPAGYFNLKAKRLKALTHWWLAFAESAKNWDTETLRARLLAVNGVGEETADSILVYAFGRTRFVVDAYTRRLVTRHGLASDKASYGEIQALFEDNLSLDNALANEYHALIVQLGKRHCRPKPQCEDCPLAWDLRVSAIPGHR